ncbi:DUF3025 domain-containing protein [Burkholderia sp. WAC0059]|uniref:DUF3025 domain-containing protein n=1 Tax=Burkholderia sp. WAC0059 TaxID=2066022 RepID=UPI000C7F1390|nr:DUF3025 domain-containing protein [Burkholderia sp. WAC0059]PLZ03324.1 DUF3025 domain-containing protein [Burkholderia sp. WAC0059]
MDATPSPARGKRQAISPVDFAGIDWGRPWFAPFGERGRRWQRAALTGHTHLLDALNADARASGQVTGRGRPLAFIAQEALPPGSAYEVHIAATGCVPTRHNLHDFFNALVWFAFPRIKDVLNARQSAAIDALGIGPTRGRLRDALTLFDENAVLFACSDASLARALRDFDWGALFVAGRAAWGTRCEVRGFGHALLEKLMAPFKACTAHAWVVEVPPDYFSWPQADRDAWLDAAVSAALLEQDALSGCRFAPLPVLGIPGWWPQNEAGAFYDDPAVFRAGRRVREADEGRGPAC